MINRLLTTAEAAEILGKAAATLCKWRVSGGGPAYIKVEGTIRYAESDIAKYIESNRTTSTSSMGNNA